MNRFENAKDDQEKEPENAKQSNMLESVLHKNRTLTLLAKLIRMWLVKQRKTVGLGV